MKLLELTSVYPDYLNILYSKNKHLAEQPYKQQMQALNNDLYGWADFWTNALNKIGYEADKIVINIVPLQLTWAKENNFTSTNLNEIALQQIKKIKPEILWYDSYDEKLLARIKKEVSSIKLILGWTGSAIANTNVWKYIDLALSCAPESVEILKNRGLNTKHLNHAFDARILTKLEDRPKTTNFSFIGQLVRSSDFHLERERILEEISNQIDIRIYSPIKYNFIKDNSKFFVKKAVYNSFKGLEKLGVSNATLNRIPIIKKASLWKENPLFVINKKLLPYIKPGIFGLEMYQAVRDSKMVLNIHANSSPRFASNMRLFEVTGVGSCLITDWKENLDDLFESDTEIITYKSAEECIDKVKWLINNPAEIDKISRNGQKKTLNRHSFSIRALQLDDIIKAELKRYVSS